MKRELKVGLTVKEWKWEKSYTACPNEEGTERDGGVWQVPPDHQLHSMSQWRGNWKIKAVPRIGAPISSYTACPNEEGTESTNRLLISWFLTLLHSMSQWRGNWKQTTGINISDASKLHSMSQWRGNWKKSGIFTYSLTPLKLHSMSQWRGNWKWSRLKPYPMVSSYTACPNEEGTERFPPLYSKTVYTALHSMSQWRGNWKWWCYWYHPWLNRSYTACPNEEGTERSASQAERPYPNEVTQHVPMKRELKGIIMGVQKNKWGVTQHVPMKRELKVIMCLTSLACTVVTQHVPMKRELKEHWGGCAMVD